MSRTAPFHDLKPRQVWRHFEAFTRIPRPSKQEQAIAEHVRGWADGHGFAVDGDATGNLCIRVPASPGRAGAPIVVLQGHLDMVCERDPASPHDAERGAIHVVRDGEWLAADGTTLGADNGIGVALALAASEPGLIEHGPLELLLTVDEETGLTGAKGLDPALVRGRTLVNLDSEEDDALFVGCAGGTDTRYVYRASRAPTGSGEQAREVAVGGLLGGHSGLDIDKHRLNAIKALTRVLDAAAAEVPLRIARLAGGNKRNAIPRDARATVLVSSSGARELERVAAEQSAALRAQYRGFENGLSIDVAATIQAPPSAFGVVDSARLIALLSALPCGIVAMSPHLPGLVETSTSLGVVTTDGETIEMVNASRSSSDAAMGEVLASLAALARLAGVDAIQEDGYPGWQPDPDSRVLTATERAYEAEFGSAPRVTAVHAGLECGLIGERIPGIDMISFGPDIEKAHAPGERVRIESVERTWRLLVRLLADLSA